VIFISTARRLINKLQDAEAAMSTGGANLALAEEYAHLRQASHRSYDVRTSIPNRAFLTCIQIVSENP
jgi:hypothetical protein